MNGINITLQWTYIMQFHVTLTEESEKLAWCLRLYSVEVWMTCLFHLQHWPINETTYNVPSCTDDSYYKYRCNIFWAVLSKWVNLISIKQFFWWQPSDRLQSVLLKRWNENPSGIKLQNLWVLFQNPASEHRNLSLDIRWLPQFRETSLSLNYALKTDSNDAEMM